MTRDEELARYARRVDGYKRKIAKLEQQLFWSENEKRITHQWAEKAWEEVCWLRDLCEKYYADAARIKTTLNDGPLREGRGVLGSDLAVSEGGSGVRFPSPDDPSLPERIDGSSAGGSMGE